MAFLHPKNFLNFLPFEDRRVEQHHIFNLWVNLDALEILVDLDHLIWLQTITTPHFADFFSHFLTKIHECFDQHHILVTKLDDQMVDLGSYHELHWVFPHLSLVHRNLPNRKVFLSDPL